MGYESDKIKKELKAECKKVKSNKNIKATMYKFIIERIGTGKVIVDKEKKLINELEKAIPKRKRYLLKDLLKYKKQSEKYWTSLKIMKTVDFMLKFGFIIVEILANIMQYDIEEKNNQDNKKIDA